MHRVRGTRIGVILIACLVVLSVLPAGVTAGGHDEGVAAKQIVFISGQAFLADGELDRQERTLLAESVLIVPGGGVAYDEARAEPAPSGEIESVSPYFAAKDLVFLKLDLTDGGLSGEERALLRDGVVMAPHTKFQVNGDRVKLTKASFDAASNTDLPPLFVASDDVLPDWFTDAAITGFGSFQTASGVVPPGQATDTVAAKQIVFLSARTISDDHHISEAELASVEDGYVVAPAGMLDGATTLTGVESPFFPDSIFSDDALGAVDLEYAPVSSVLDAGPVGKTEVFTHWSWLIVAPGSTYIQDEERTRGLPQYVVIDKDTTMGTPITLVSVAPETPDWLGDATGTMVTDSENMLPEEPFLAPSGKDIVFVMPGDNTAISGTEAALVDSPTGESQIAVAVFPGSPDAFLKAKKAFDEAQFPGDDTPIVADPGDEVIVDPGDEVVTDPDNMIPTPERDTIPGNAKGVGGGAVAKPGSGSLDGEDRLFATRVRKAFDGENGYGFIVVQPDSETVYFGYVSGGELVTDPDRMDPETALSFLETVASGDSEIDP